MDHKDPHPIHWQDYLDMHNRVGATGDLIRGFWVPGWQVPRTAVFRELIHDYGYARAFVEGAIDSPNAWWLYPFDFLYEPSVSPRFFAAGMQLGVMGNTACFIVAIRDGDRGFWFREQTWNVFAYPGENPHQDSDSETEDVHDKFGAAWERWRDGERLVAVGCHVEKLPAESPPLFTGHPPGVDPEWLR